MSVRTVFRLSLGGALLALSAGCAASDVEDTAAAEGAAKTSRPESIPTGHFKAALATEYGRPASACANYTMLEIYHEAGRAIARLEDVSEGSCPTPVPADPREYVLERTGFGVDVDEEGRILNDWNPIMCGERNYEGSNKGGTPASIVIGDHRAYVPAPGCRDPYGGAPTTAKVSFREYRNGAQRPGMVGDEAVAPPATPSVACDLDAREAAQPKLHYKGDRRECPVIFFTCDTGSSYFSDECGCGCKDD